MRQCTATLFLALAVVSPLTCAQSNIPSFVAKLIERYKTFPVGHSPDSVWKYTYKGATVFYVPRIPCCDFTSSLYSADGNLLCHPDGGIVGIGDGKCPDFFEERSDGERLWSDGATEQSR
jgi:hypothetical protein